MSQRAASSDGTSGTKRIKNFAVCLQGLHPSPPALWDYTAELKHKNQALLLFGQDQHWPVAPLPIIPSPRPRHYRTLSKRQLSARGNRLEWYRKSGEADIDAILEADGHEPIYRYILSILHRPPYAELARHLHFLIVRGSYTTFSVILNVDRLDAVIVRKCKQLAEHLHEAALSVQAVFTFFDPSRSPYYLESQRPPVAVTFKKIYGPSRLALSIQGRVLFYEPTAFSQINESILTEFTQTAQRLLRPHREQRLIDLYCGYGLFSHVLADQYAEVWGYDVNAQAIRSAVANRTPGRSTTPVHFRATAINERFVRHTMHKSGGRAEVLLLDPPFQGTEAGVIEALAERAPREVLHIFCNIDRVRQETSQWLRHGYEVRVIQPLDMFPGTTNVEIMVLLEA
jgi:tRNA/tmRNA/rRNA uracil-C5-methylase (TrmA/RlmC/RlmD family)